MKAPLFLTVALMFAACLMASVPATACEFFFNHQSITAPLGTTGTIAVRVLQDHNDCSMKDGLDGYQFDTENLQIVSAGEWNQIGPMLFERSMTVTLSQVGTGYFRIWKECDREGYGGDEIPITVLAGGDIWNKAAQGEFPYTTETALEFIQGNPTIDRSSATLVLNGQTFNISSLPEETWDQMNTLQIFFAPETKQVLLILNEGIYYRFD